MAQCCKCLFIAQEDFYSRTDLPKDVESKKIQLAIQETQEEYILPLFCESLYLQLCDQITAGTLTDINEQLLCYIKDVHVRYAYAEFLYLQINTVTKESVVRKVSDESEFTSESSIGNLSQYWRMKAKNYVEDLTDFMKDNVSLNPLFSNDCNDCEEGLDNDDWGFIAKGHARH